MLKEFKPALRFLFIFLGAYLIGNVLYGVFIEACNPNPDPVTHILARQTSAVLHVFGEQTTTTLNKARPTVFLNDENEVILNIYEGCNGLNVMIVFVAFLLAYGGSYKKMLWFLPAGIVIIHLANIVRIMLLYFVARNYESYFYYVHKYVFTAAIYIIVFALWVVWVTLLHDRPRNTTPAKS
jgi:exosortase family protein XrtF